MSKARNWRKLSGVLNSGVLNSGVSNPRASFSRVSFSRAPSSRVSNHRPLYTSAKSNSVWQSKPKDISLIDIFTSIAKKWFEKKIGFYSHNHLYEYILYLDKPHYKKEIKIDENGNVDYSVITEKECKDDYYNHLHLQIGNDDKYEGIVTQKIGSPKNICIMTDILSKYNKFISKGHKHDKIILYLVKQLYLVSGYYTYFENEINIINKSKYFEELNVLLIAFPHTYSLTKCSQKQSRTLKNNTNLLNNLNKLSIRPINNKKNKHQ